MLQRRTVVSLMFAVLLHLISEAAFTQNTSRREALLGFGFRKETE